VSLRVNALLKIRALCADFYEDDPSFADQMERALCELETGSRQEVEREKIAASAPTDLEWTEGDAPGGDDDYLVMTDTGMEIACFVGGVWRHHDCEILRHARINTSKEEAEL
jgi:hypothetical protein